MTRIRRAPVLMFVLGALTVGAIFAGQAGWAALGSHAADEQIFACAKTQNGQLRIVDAGRAAACRASRRCRGASRARRATPARRDRRARRAQSRAPRAPRATPAPTGATGAEGPQGETGRHRSDRARRAKRSATGPAGPAGPAGPEGPPGSSAAELTSPNGLFKVEITDHGVFIRGPGGTVFVDHRGAGTTSNRYYGR